MMLRIAIAQLNPLIGDLVGNAQRILMAAEQAAAAQAHLLLTPELSLCGYPPRDLLLNGGFVDRMAQVLEDLAGRLPPELATLVGVVQVNHQAAQQGSKPLFNSTALLQAGQIQQIFHKRLLPTYDVFDEHRYFAPGDRPNVLHLTIDSQPIAIGVTICEDLWNDEEFWGKRNYAENPIADLAALGVALTINLSASPYTVGKQKTREAMLSHAAARFDQPLLYVNQVGGNDDLIFDGSSIAVNRRGEVIFRARAFAEDLQWLDFDWEQGDWQPGHLTPWPESDDAEIWAALVLGVGDYGRKCGFQRAVIGLSGGIDSALVAAIAAAAFGPQQVLGVLMPSPYSSDHSVSDALQLAQNLGIQTLTLPIADLMQGYDRALSQPFADTTPDITEENIQSRIRGNLLMAIANKFGHLLLSTGNKSEMAVGYCTLYGDMNGGLAAIADVPKTRVYSLCQWLNNHAGQVFGSRLVSGAETLIPKHILTKPPSAELKPGQVDQDSLPDYAILDDILQRLIHDRQSLDQIIAAGHGAEVVQRVFHLVTRAEFKRRQAPPGLKITDRAFGTGWRMPIASRWKN